MKEYSITIDVDGERHYDERWSGYCEDVAVAQAMLYHAQRGARSVSIEYIKEVTN